MIVTPTAPTSRGVLSPIADPCPAVYLYAFDGLGPARSLLLAEAWHKYGDSATHFFIGDPDWVFSFGADATVKSGCWFKGCLVTTPLLTPRPRVSLFVFLSFFLYFILFFFQLRASRCGRSWRGSWRRRTRTSSPFRSLTETVKFQQ